MRPVLRVALVAPAVLDMQEGRKARAHKLVAEAVIRKLALVVTVQEKAAMELRHPYLAHLLPTAVAVVLVLAVREVVVVVVVVVVVLWPAQERQTRVVAAVADRAAGPAAVADRAL